MSDDHDHAHAHQVDTWMEKAGGHSPEHLLQLFERAMGALWARAYVPLGEVTLAAIVDRVLYVAAEKFPPFASLKIEPTGIAFHEFREKIDGISERELAEGVRFTVTEFIAVIGNLTAEILTPALHAELSKVALTDQAAGGEHVKGQG